MKLVECPTVKKSEDLRNKKGTAANTIIRVKEVELTIKSHNIKYLPTLQKFNTLMDDELSLVNCVDGMHSRNVLLRHS